MLEIRLREPIAVDLSVRLLTPALGRRVAAGLGLPDFAELADRWESDPALGRAISALWLEFDLSHRPVRSAPVTCARLEAPCAPAWLTGVLFPAMLGRPLERLQATTIHRLLDRLPDSARLLYVFDLSARGRRQVRLELFGPSADELIPYLRRATGSRFARQVADPVRVLGDLDRLHLSIDVDEAGRLSPRIGIDGSYARLPAREPRWNELFERLVAEGLCSPRNRRAVFAWPGHDSFWTDPEGWPLPGGGAGGYCVRALSHVKLVTGVGTAPEAKAYLLFGHVVPE